MRLPAVRWGASRLAILAPRLGLHTRRAQATTCLFAWNQVIFGPGTSLTSFPEAPAPPLPETGPRPPRRVSQEHEASQEVPLSWSGHAPGSPTRRGRATDRLVKGERPFA